MASGWQWINKVKNTTGSGTCSWQRVIEFMPLVFVFVCHYVLSTMYCCAHIQHTYIFPCFYKQWRLPTYYVNVLFMLIHSDGPNECSEQQFSCESSSATNPWPDGESMVLYSFDRQNNKNLLSNITPSLFRLPDNAPHEYCTLSVWFLTIWMLQQYWAKVFFIVPHGFPLGHCSPVVFNCLKKSCLSSTPSFSITKSAFSSSLSLSSLCLLDNQ